MFGESALRINGVKGAWRLAHIVFTQGFEIPGAGVSRFTLIGNFGMTAPEPGIEVSHWNLKVKWYAVRTVVDDIWPRGEPRPHALCKASTETSPEKTAQEGRVAPQLCIHPRIRHPSVIPSSVMNHPIN